MFSTMKIATIAFLSLTSLVSALPNTPPAYGATTTTTKKSTTSATTKPTTSCSTWVKTDHSTGHTVVTTYKPVTTWVPTTIKSDIPRPYTTKSCSKNTGVKTETRPVTKPFTDVSTAYSTALSTKTELVTKGRKSTPSLQRCRLTNTNDMFLETPKVSVITTTVLVDDVQTRTTVVTEFKPYVTTKTGVSTGYTTITKPNNGQTCAVITKTRTDHSNVVTSTPKVTSTPCSATKPYTTDIVKTESKCTTVGGPGGYGW